MNRRIFAALSVVLTTAWVAGAVPSAFAAAAAKSAPSILVVGATGGTAGARGRLPGACSGA